ncbi:YadA-like family protein, partial [Vreelandella zhaodongensis]
GSLTINETLIDGNQITTNNVTVNETLTVEGDTFLNENLTVAGSTTINENLTVEGDTYLGDSFSIVNNEAFYDGPVTEGDHITNKSYVDNSVTELGDTPLTFGANEGDDSERRLGDRLDIVGEADAEGNSNIITKLTDEETLELALNDDLEIGNSITVGDTFIDGDSITTNNMTVNENLTVEGDTFLNENLTVAGSTTINENLTVQGDTYLGDSFSIVNNEAFYDGPVTENNHITNKQYVDNSVTELGDTPLTFGANEGGDTDRRLGDRLDIVGEEDAEGDSNIITKLTDEETLELALNDDLKIGNSITVGDTFIDGDSITANNMTVNKNLTVAGETRLGDNFFVNNEGNVTYSGDITEGDHIVNKNYLDGSIGELADRPIYFAGNTGERVAKRLDETLTISGELARNADATGANLRVDSDSKQLNLVMAKNLTDLESITLGGTFISNEGITLGDTTINGDRISSNNLTVTGETKLGDNFFANSDGNVTYTGDITEGAHIVNKDYVDSAGDQLISNNPLTFGANEGDDTKRRLGDRLDIVGEADDEGNSNIITKLTDEQTLELALSDDLKIGNSIAVGEDGPVISGDGIDMSDNKITNVADGSVSADSKDAINGSQLYQLESIVTNVTGDISNEYVTNNGRGIRYVRTNDSDLAVSDAFAEGQGSTAVGYDARATADRALAMGYDAIASHQGSVALGEGARTAEAVSTASVEIAGQTYQFAGSSPVATVSVGSAGAERTVTNVAAGRVSAESTDAINGSQLYATNQAVGVLDNRVTNVEGDISNITNNLADLDDRAVKYDRNDDGSVDYNTITLEGDGGTTITNVAPGDIAQNSTDAVNGSQLWEVSNQITNIEQGGSKYFRANSDGPAADSQGTDSIAMGPSSVAAGDRSVASGAGAQANAEGSVALGAGSVADREGMNGERERFSNESVASTQGAVSVGSEGNERQITNVAGGTRDTDAVNVRQLDAVQRGSVNYDRDADGNVDYSTITLKGEEGTTITNVAPGVNETDAVNVGQMNELGQRFSNEINNVHGRIDSVERNANAGSASAIAASTVPQAWMPGKSMVGVGAGTYGGESAVSVGVSRL